MFVLTRSEELDISEGESCYSSVRRCSDRRSLSECNVIHVVRICLTSLRQLQRRLADAVEIKATQLTANAGTTLDFIFLHFLFRGFFFFFSLGSVERKSAFNTFSYNTTCIWRGAAPLSHLLLTPQWAAIGANTVGLVRAEIALLSRAQLCFQTSASDNEAC